MRGRSGLTDHPLAKSQAMPPRGWRTGNWDPLIVPEISPRREPRRRGRETHEPRPENRRTVDPTGHQLPDSLVALETITTGRRIRDGCQTTSSGSGAVWPRCRRSSMLRWLAEELDVRTRHCPKYRLQPRRRRLRQLGERSRIRLALIARLGEREVKLSFRAVTPTSLPSGPLRRGKPSAATVPAGSFRR